MQLFLGESIQRVDCVASFSGCHLAFCCLLKQQSDRKLSGVCMGTRLLRLWVAKEFAARQSHVALFPNLLKVNVLIVYSCIPALVRDVIMQVGH